jgi:hypothetical protein
MAMTPEQIADDLELKRQSGLYSAGQLAEMRSRSFGERTAVEGHTDAFGNVVGKLGSTSKSSAELKADLAYFDQPLEPGARFTLGEEDPVARTRQRWDEVQGLDVERLGDEFLADQSARKPDVETQPDPSFKVRFYDR